ncbi:hypothetical protein Bca101_027025 [Brassica carinata]
MTAFGIAMGELASTTEKEMPVTASSLLRIWQERFSTGFLGWRPTPSSGSTTNPANLYTRKKGNGYTLIDEHHYIITEHFSYSMKLKGSIEEDQVKKQPGSGETFFSDSIGDESRLREVCEGFLGPPTGVAEAATSDTNFYWDTYVLMGREDSDE